MFLNIATIFQIIGVIKAILDTIFTITYWVVRFNWQMIKWEARKNFTKVGDQFYTIRKIFKLYRETITNGSTVEGDKICIFSSFEPKGISDVTYAYLKHLKYDLGFSIFFVSNCPLLKHDRYFLTGICFKIMERENKGHNFGAYKDAILYCLTSIDFTKLSNLLITGDSIFPLYSFENSFTEGQKLDCDFWGFTEAKRPDGDNHFIGGYFICFKPTAFLSDAFKNFWKDHEYISDRLITRSKGEYILCETLEKAMLKSASLIDCQKICEIIMKQENLETFMLDIIFSYPETSRMYKLNNLMSFLPVLISSNCYWNPYFALKYVPEIPYLRKWDFCDIIVKKDFFVNELRKLENTFIDIEIIIKSSVDFEEDKWKKILSQKATPAYLYTSYYS